MRYLFILAIIISVSVNAQSTCVGAGGTAQTGIAVCGTLVFPQANLPTCTGPNIPNTGCTAAVTSSNSQWYRFKCYQSGTLGFLIIPNSTSDDYDWEVMNITGRNPSDVYTTNLMASLNLSGTTGNTGCTNAGTSDVNCEGTTNRFNRLLPIVAGNEYLLMVTNWSASGLGYNLSFTGGTALLTNNVPPDIQSTTMVVCNNAQVKLKFTEDLLCNSLTSSGSEFIITSGSNPISSVISVCNGAINAFNELTLELQNPLPAGNYTVTIAEGTDGNTLLDICNNPMPVGTNFTFTVLATPLLPSVVTPVIACQNAPSPTLSATGNNLLWYTSATGGAGSSTTPILNTTTAGTTSYFVSQFTNGCESARAPIVVTINPTPVSPTVITPVSYCINTVSNALTATGNNLTWYNMPLGGLGNINAPIPSTNTLGTSSYYVTDKIGICESERTKLDVIVNDYPLAPIVISPIIYCQNDISNSLTATGNNLNWYTNMLGGVGNINAPTPSTLNNGNTNYYVSQTLNNCESPRASITVTVNIVPNLPVVISPISYCQNENTVPLTAIGNNLFWFTSASGGVALTAAPTPNSLIAGNTTYFVISDNGLCKSARVPIEVVINPTPNAPIVNTPINYCVNSNALPLTAIGNNLKWYTNSTGGISSNIAPTPSTLNNGDIDYFVSQTIGVCESPRALLRVTVTNDNLILNVGNDTTICEGQSVTLNPSSIPAATTYEWEAIKVPTSTISNIAIKNTNVNPIDSAQYVLKAFLGGCESTDTIAVNVIWKPIVDVNPTQIKCFSDSTLLQSTTSRISNISGTILNYKWSPSTNLITPNANNTIAFPTLNTTYTITLNTTKDNYGCDFNNSDIVNVQVRAIVPAYAGKDTIAVKGGMHQLQGSGGNNYFWYNNTGAIIINPNIAKAITVLQNDTRFYLTVIDTVGCKGSSSVFVKVYNGPTYYVPNSFTPNNDGLNDVFRAIPVGIVKTYYFRVYNRYGQQLFETNEFLKGWDGYFKGTPQKQGTYTWVIKGIDINNKIVAMKGTINILR